MIIQFEDPDEQKLAALLQAQGAVPMPMGHQYIQRILAQVGSPASTDTVDLAALRSVIEKDVIEYATKHPSSEWLWFLRKLPPFYLSWLHRDAKVAISYLRMAEALTNMQRPWPDDRARTPEPNYQANPTNVRHLTQLLFRIQFLHYVSSHMEMKGRLAPLRALLETLDDLQDHDKVDKASDLYLARREIGDDNPLAGAATFVTVGSNVSSQEINLHRPLLIFSTSPWKLLYYDADALAPAGYYLTRFIPQLAKPQGRLYELLRTSKESAAREEAVALLALLIGLDRAVVHNLISVMRFGYLLLWEEDVRRAIEESLKELDDTIRKPEATSAAALELVKRLAPSVWPLRPGTALRPYGPGLMVDLVGAREALFNRLSRTARIPSDIQGFSTAFEVDVQSLFEGTRWAPPRALAQIRGRPLRHNGRAVTDIDALGMNKGVLLLVSAKAWPRKPGVDTGEFTDIQNVMRDAADKLDEWNTNVEYFRQHPQGDNYDFSSASHIVGVLCLPFLPFVEPGPLTEMPIPGLYAVTSVDELRVWLLQNA